MIDTLRADELGCYGAKYTRTPEIDRLAAQGLLFERASAPAAATRPSIASLMTGVPVPVHGAENLNHRVPQRDSLPRLAELLRKQGYHTAAVVANPNVASLFGFSVGFDEYHELFGQSSKNDRAGVEEMSADAERVVRRARDVIAEIPRGKPWFLYVLCIDPHDPYTPPPPYETMYHRRASGPRDGSIEAIQRVAKDNRDGELRIRAIQRMRALYRGEISYTDHHFGTLISFLRDSNLLDKTLVAITADHGEEFFEHGLRGHSKTVYEEVTHVPLILRLPPHPSAPASFPSQFATTDPSAPRNSGDAPAASDASNSGATAALDSGDSQPGASPRPAGLRRPEPVDLLDLAATLVLAAGGEKPAHWVGRDLRSTLAPRPITSAQSYKQRKLTALRNDGWKLIRDDAAGKSELFNLDQDRFEENPLSESDSLPAATTLSALLQDYRRATSALRDTLLGELDADSVDVPPDVLKALKSLGYVE